MNFLLLQQGELDAAGRAVLSGRRAEHVRTVLRAEIGATLRAGVVDGALGTATVCELTPERVVVDTVLREVPPASDDVLLLAVPRPKVLMRIYAHAAALGFRRIVLCRTWRVEKSHLQSKALRADVAREQLLLGLEQAGRTRVPELLFFPRFKPMVEDSLPGLGLPALRFLGHPAAATTTAQLAPLARAPFALAIGPDGGFLPYEVDALTAAGFLPVSAGTHALRTETALAVLTGQLDLLRARGSLGT